MNQADIGKSINMLAHQIKRRINRLLEDSGLTGVQGRILHFIIDQEQPVFQRDIEQVFHLRRSTTTGILQLMEKKEIIERRSVAYDARLKQIIVLEAGYAIDQQASQRIAVLEAVLKKNISEKELEVFIQVLDKIQENLQKEV